MPYCAAALVLGDIVVKKPVFCCSASLDCCEGVWATSSASKARNSSTSLPLQSRAQRGHLGVTAAAPRQGPTRPLPGPLAPTPQDRLSFQEPAFPTSADRSLHGPKQLCPVPYSHATRVPDGCPNPARLWGCGASPSPPWYGAPGAPGLPFLGARASHAKPRAAPTAGEGERVPGCPRPPPGPTAPPAAHLRRGREAAPAPAPAGGSSAPPCRPRAAHGRGASARGSVSRGGRQPAPGIPSRPRGERGRRQAGMAFRAPAGGRRPTDASVGQWQAAVGPRGGAEGRGREAGMGRVSLGCLRRWLRLCGGDGCSRGAQAAPGI